MRRHLLVIVLLGYAHLAAGGIDWPDPSIVDSAIQAKADQMAAGFQGAYVVAKAGKVLATNGMGKANRVSGESNNIQTSFRLASVSKPLTAVAIMQLYERGLLAPDDKISDHLDDYGSNGERIKIHHLLTHSSGIPDYISLVSNPSSPVEILDSFKSRPLQFTPGSRNSYSNSNFAVLGYLIERKTGMKYAEYMTEHVWLPSRMKHAGFHFPEHPGPGFACPSGGNPDGPWESNTKAYSAGALYASVVDMLFFNHALYNGVLLKRETVEVMHKNHIGGYGYGFLVNGGGVSHNGVIPGFTAQLYSYPESQGLVMVLSNGGTSAPSLAGRLRSLLR